MKKEYKLALVGLFTLFVFVIGSSFAFFQLNSTNTSSSSNFTGELENITNYGKSVLSGGLDGLHIKINASDMAIDKIGTHYYATVDSKKDYELERQKHEISKVTISEGVNNENVVYSCTSDLTIQLEGNMLEDSLVSGDGMIYFSGSNMRLNPKNIDLAELISKSTDKIVEDKNIKEYKNTIEYTISGNGEATLETDIEIVNRDKKQNDMAGKNINITITNENLVCSVSGKKVYARLDTLSGTGTKYRSSEYRDKIVSVSFVDYVPSEEELSQKVVNWDLTDTSLHNGYSTPSNSVIGWLEETEENPEQYNLYIGSKDNIYTIYLSYAFAYMANLQEINFDNLNTSETTDMYWMFYNCKNLVSLDLSTFDTSKVTNMSRMFYQVQADLPFKDWPNFVISNVKDMRNMFEYYKGESLDLSTFDTSKVTNMSEMFRGATSSLSFKDWPNFVTSSVTNMSRMFLNYGGSELDLRNFDTSKVTNMSLMFSGTSANIKFSNNFGSSSINMSEMFKRYQGTTLDLSTFDTSKVTDMSSMFAGYESANGLIANIIFPKEFGSAATNMSSMFAYYKGESLNLSTFDISSVTDMSHMFSDASTNITFPQGFGSSATNMSYMFSFYKGTTLDLSTFDTSSVTNMSSMFSSYKGTTLDLSTFDTSSVTNMSGMFSSYKGTTLDLSTFDTSYVTNMSYMFSNCTSLTELKMNKATFDGLTTANSYNQIFGYLYGSTSDSRVPSDIHITVKTGQDQFIKDRLIEIYPDGHNARIDTVD